MQKIKVFIECENNQIPAYAHETDAGLDICAAEDVTLAPGETNNDGKLAIKLRFIQVSSNVHA